MNDTITVKREKETGQREVSPPAVPNQAEAAWPSFNAFRGEMERLFDHFARGLTQFPNWRRSPEVSPPWRFETAFGMSAPAVEVAEKDEEFQVTAEVPGMEAGDVEVSVSGDVLTIKGEKKEEKETKEKNYYLSERRYGSFQRSFQLPAGVEADKIAAKLEKGVLSIQLPKTKETLQQQRKIPIASK